MASTAAGGDDGTAPRRSKSVNREQKGPRCRTVGRPWQSILMRLQGSLSAPGYSPEDATLAARPSQAFWPLVGTILALSLLLQTAPVFGIEGGDLGASAVVSRMIDAVNEAPFSDHAEADRVGRKSFDVTAIAKTILGSYWSTASAREQARFIDTLSGAVRISVFDLLKRHGKLDIAVGKTRNTLNGDSIVETDLTESSGDMVKVDWRLRPCAYGLCIVDLIVNGASVAIQLRDEAAPILSANNGAIDELSRRLLANPTHPFN